MTGYYVYVLRSAEGYRYFGHTMEIERRMEEHSGGQSHSTKNGNRWEIDHLEEYETGRMPCVVRST